MSFLTTFSFPFMLNSSLGGQGCFWIYSTVSFVGDQKTPKINHLLVKLVKTLLFCATGFVFIASAVPETSGKTEAEISMLFQKVFFYLYHKPLTIFCHRCHHWIFHAFPEGRQEQWWEGEPSNADLEVAASPQKLQEWPAVLRFDPKQKTSREWQLRLKCFTSVKLFS